jgi:uncharacterized protein (TIGR02594 family)
MYSIAERFVGIKEVAGSSSNPAILAMLRLDTEWPMDDRVPWCGAAMNYWAWLLRLPRSKSLRARSWLSVGTPIQLIDAKAENDVVILRNKLTDPGPDVIDFQGHVTLFAGIEGSRILGLGGNQSDTVNVSYFSQDHILGVRRLA